MYVSVPTGTVIKIFIHLTNNLTLTCVLSARQALISSTCVNYHMRWFFSLACAFSVQLSFSHPARLASAGLSCIICSHYSHPITQYESKKEKKNSQINNPSPRTYEYMDVERLLIAFNCYSQSSRRTLHTLPSPHTYTQQSSSLSVKRIIKNYTQTR